MCEAPRCGTISGYMWRRRHGLASDGCSRCQQARREYDAERYAAENAWRDGHDRDAFETDGWGRRIPNGWRFG